MEHVEHLDMEFSILSHHQLYVNKKKCAFGNKEIAYMGHVISQKGVVADPKKIQAMVEWPTLTTLKHLRGFLGLTVYYRKFVASYAWIARSLTDQLHEDQFGWNSVVEDAFQALKIAMISVSILTLPQASNVTRHSSLPFSNPGQSLIFPNILNHSM
ncbi:uncharacterized mitochondrial protein AtMg00860-like [Humulus lupulus]|uniref:uncharacterized mitochondrial protein AtMg00860-like n=1 Tax=Humulus lupulus TaxID=3486 RepID=UPI002B406195|nr:uncharacterized mitochondrial protein AtMg00860-like [Humulus lupulus]